MWSKWSEILFPYLVVKALWKLPSILIIQVGDQVRYKKFL